MLKDHKALAADMCGLGSTTSQHKLRRWQGILQPAAAAWRWLPLEAADLVQKLGAATEALILRNLRAIADWGKVQLQHLQDVAFASGTELFSYFPDDSSYSRCMSAKSCKLLIATCSIQESCHHAPAALHVKLHATSLPCTHKYSHPQ